MLTTFLALALTAPYTSVRIDNIPHVRQRPDFCGEACVEMVLKKRGHHGDQDWVFDLTGVDPKEGRGAYTRGLVRALGRIGFVHGKVWHTILAKKADEGMEKIWADLHDDLKNGVPSIVCMHYDDSPNTTEHFRLIVGYDAKKDEVLYHEPAEEKGAYRRMKREVLFRRWPLKYQKRKWMVIRARLEPGEIKPYQAPKGFTDADFAQHVQALKPEIPAGFDFRIEKPFVVIGDVGGRKLEGYAQKIVRWTVDQLKSLYFDKDPTEIVDVWLFKDDESYRKNTQKIFGERPDTPYGYYSATHNALIMNISTGGGTLVHEIVHPFMGANFPNCPDWLNEGIGSLYEQCDAVNGRITGLTNWRLPGLQKAIRLKILPSFATLIRDATPHAFYTEDEIGTNYAQARYLVYYLQEKKLLTTYYHQLVKNQKSDVTGYQTLKQVLGEEDLEAFQERWEKWVLTLRFP